MRKRRIRRSCSSERFDQNSNFSKLVLINNLKQLRAEKKLSQSELAEKAHVSRNTISSIETGEFVPSAKLAAILCIAFDKNFEDLFYLE